MPALHYPDTSPSTASKIHQLVDEYMKATYGGDLGISRNSGYATSWYSTNNPAADPYCTMSYFSYPEVVAITCVRADDLGLINLMICCYVTH